LHSLYSSVLVDGSSTFVGEAVLPKIMPILRVLTAFCLTDAQIFNVSLFVDDDNRNLDDPTTP
jgi:hypothetical protein